jgi:hypothetical protein
MPMRSKRFNPHFIGERFSDFGMRISDCGICNSLITNYSEIRNPHSEIHPHFIGERFSDCGMGISDCGICNSLIIKILKIFTESKFLEKDFLQKNPFPKICSLWPRLLSSTWLKARNSTFFVPHSKVGEVATSPTFKRLIFKEL